MSRTRQITERHHRPRRQWGRLSRILLGVFFALLLLVSLLPLAGRVINIGVVAPAAASALGPPRKTPPSSSWAPPFMGRRPA